MRLWFSIIILLSFFHTVFSQTVIVLDRENLQPLELATLSSLDPRASAITDLQGRANIDDFQGSDQIQIRMIGYATQVMSYRELEEAGFKVYMEPTNVTLDQVVVSATRWDQPIRDVPSKICVVTSRQIAFDNPQTSADLLGNSGEVFIQKSQMGGGSPMIRGFATNRLLIAVDGIRMNTAIFRSGNLQNVISLDPFSMERAEILFGPGSVIYGSDAIGGVMSFHTLEPRFSEDDKTYLTGNVAGRYSSVNNERTGHFDIRLGWKQWAAVTSVSHFDYDDLKMGRYGPEDYLRNTYVWRVDGMDRIVTNADPLVQRPTGYTQTNLMQKFAYRPGEDWESSYSFHYSATSDYPRYDRLIRERNGIPRSAEWNYGPQIWMMNRLNLTCHKGSSYFDEMDLKLAHQFFEESRIDRDFGDLLRNERVEQVHAFSANLDMNKDLQSGRMLYYGLEAVYNDVHSTGKVENIQTGSVSDGPSRYPESSWSSLGAYFTYQFRLTDRMLMHAGLRYNQTILKADFDTAYYPFPFTEATLNKGALTGSAGVVFNPSPDWAISTKFSTGFRAPNVDDAGKVFDSEPGSVVVPNPDLKAEYAYNAEFNLSKVFGSVAKIDLTGYATYLNNALVRRDYQLDGRDSIFYDGQLSRVQAIQNASRAFVYGFQVHAEIKLPAGFGLITHYNVQKGQEEMDDGSTSPSRHAAPAFGESHLNFSTKKVKLDLYARYCKEVSYDELNREEKGKPYLYAENDRGLPYSPSWYTLNFRIMYQFTDHLNMTAGLENITNERYRPYSSGITAPGRNFVISLKTSF